MATERSSVCMGSASLDMHEQAPVYLPQCCCIHFCPEIFEATIYIEIPLLRVPNLYIKNKYKLLAE
jgi:hypothetical protein